MQLCGITIQIKVGGVLNFQECLGNIFFPIVELEVRCNEEFSLVGKTNICNSPRILKSTI